MGSHTARLDGRWRAPDPSSRLPQRSPVRKGVNHAAHPSRMGVGLKSTFSSTSAPTYVEALSAFVCEATGRG